MENPSDNSDEDTLEVATKTWNKIINSVEKVGYREGIEDGSTSVFQKSFDTGYKQAFNSAFILGVYKGLAKCVSKDIEHPTEIENILSNTKKGLCYICVNETEQPIDATQKSTEEIESCQSKHSEEILKILYNYFDPILQKNNIDFDFTNFYS